LRARGEEKTGREKREAMLQGGVSFKNRRMGEQPRAKKRVGPEHAREHTKKDRRSLKVKEEEKNLRERKARGGFSKGQGPRS